MAAEGKVQDQAFVTLTTNDTYSLGALVLAHSLRRVGTTRQLVVMVTTGVSQGIRQQLSEAFDRVVEVDVLDSGDKVNLALLSRRDLGVTFTKLHCWRLTDYSKCVFMDADTMVLKNCDELFERDELSAAPDPGWPDCFNSGVFVFQPSEETYKNLLSFAMEHGSFDGGDQGLLNLYFSDWSTKDIRKHLPFTYNVVAQAFYSYLPAFRQFGKDVRVVHFIGAEKPWHTMFNLLTQQVELGPSTLHSQEYLQMWWGLFLDKVNPGLDPNVAGLVGELSGLSIESNRTYTSEQLQDRQRQYEWERGHVDYLGMDSFSYIQQHIQDVISGKTSPEPPADDPKEQDSAAAATQRDPNQTLSGLPTDKQ